MKALIYLTKRSLINNLKQACRKPLTLILLIFGIAYGIFVVAMLGILVLSIHIDSPNGLLAVLIIWSIYGFLGNFMAYSTRKGFSSGPPTRTSYFRHRSARSWCCLRAPG